MSDRPLRWGILGTARIALEFIKAVKLSYRSEVAAVASRDLPRARDWAKRNLIPHAFGSYDELLRSGEIDLIYNPLPNSLHAEWTIKALKAGRPVLCEKPLAANGAEARAIAETAARTGLHVAEGFMYRHHPQWDRVRELLVAGAIGRVTSMHSQFTFMLDDPSAIPASKDLAGGALMDVGCYCVHFSRMIAGCEPSWVSAFERRDQVDITMAGLLEFPNGILSHFETSIGNFERHRAEIAGTEGAILIEEPWVPGDRPTFIRLSRPDVAPKTITIPPADSYLLEIEHFISACKDAEAARWPISDAVSNMAVLDALFASARERRAIRIE